MLLFHEMEKSKSVSGQELSLRRRPVAETCDHWSRTENVCSSLNLVIKKQHSPSIGTSKVKKISPEVNIRMSR